MGLFSKKPKRPKDQSNESDEYVLREELESEVERLQDQFRSKQADLEEVSGRLESVRKEYDVVVTNLMAVKKEANQKKAEMATLYRDKSKASEQDVKQLAKIRLELEKATKEHTEIKIKIAQEQDMLHSLRSQAQTGKTAETQGTRDHDTILDEKKLFAQASNETEPKGVIQAASAVVGSLKSKLDVARLELEKEKHAHAKTKQELKKLKDKSV